MKSARETAEQRRSPDQIGLEAVDVPLALNLGSSDSVFSHSEHLAINVVRSAPQHHALMNSASSPMVRAIAAAIVSKLTGNSVVSAVMMRDEEDLAQNEEAIKLAGREKLPIVFVIENNRWSHAAPGPHATARDLSKKHAYRFPVIAVDGNDAVAVFRVTSETVARARQGYGPTLIEAHTFRPNSAPFDSATPEQRQRWATCDPLVHMKQYATKHGHWSEEWDRTQQSP